MERHGGAGELVEQPAPAKEPMHNRTTQLTPGCLISIRRRVQAVRLRRHEERCTSYVRSRRKALELGSTTGLRRTASRKANLEGSLRTGLDGSSRGAPRGAGNPHGSSSVGHAVSIENPMSRSSEKPDRRVP